jgi:hypothetical protein
LKFDDGYSFKVGTQAGDFIYFAGYTGDHSVLYFGRTLLGNNATKHVRVSPLSGTMDTCAENEFEIVDYDSPTNTSNTVEVSETDYTHMNGQEIPSFQFSNPPYISDVVYKITDFTDDSLSGNDTSTISIPLTCSASGSSEITYSVVADGDNTVPSWVTLDSTNQKINVEVPDLSVETTYTFKIRATTSGSDYDKLVTLDVSPTPITSSSSTLSIPETPDSEGKTTK